MKVYPGCGLELNEDGQVQVKSSDLAGYGLIVGDDCTLDVNTGCGLTIDEDAVTVYTPDMAGDGLEADGNCQLKVKPGCGLELSAGTVKVKPSDLAGDGLVVGDDCALDVNAGCGLTIDEDVLKVYTPDMAGQGLNYDSTYCQMYIDPGCGITLEGGKKVGVHADSLAGTCLVKEGDCKLGIDLTEEFGPSFSAVTAVSLTGNCYGIYLGWTVTPFHFNVNPCGLFLGFEAGTPVPNQTYLPLGCCCDPADLYADICYYCDYPPPPPDPDPDPDPVPCEGECEWEYQEGTGWVLTSSTCPEGCTCPQPIDDGLPQSIATTACVQTIPDPDPDPVPGSCPSPSTLYATVTPDGCSGVAFTLNNDGPGSWTGSSPMGSCACPGMPIEYWDLSLNCSEGAWTIGLAAPTGSTVLSAVTVVSSSPLQLSITGTMTCEGAYGQQAFNILITITE